MPASKRILVNISGPYAVGKDTVLNALIDRFRDRVHRVSTITTRPVSPNDDPSYTHLAAAAFDAQIRDGRWLVNRQLGGATAYGTSLDEIEHAGRRGQVALHSIYAGPDGAGTLRTVFASSLLSIALLPSAGSLDDQLAVLRNRLLRRNRDDEAAVRARLANQESVIAYVLENPAVPTLDGHVMPVFDHVIVNDSLDETVHRLVSLVCTEVFRVPDVSAFR